MAKRARAAAAIAKMGAELAVVPAALLLAVAEALVPTAAVVVEPAALVVVTPATAAVAVPSPDAVEVGMVCVDEPMMMISPGAVVTVTPAAWHNDRDCASAVAASDAEHDDVKQASVLEM